MRTGVPGAALSWTVRAAFDAILLFVAARLAGGVSFSTSVSNGFVKATAGIGIFACTLLLISFTRTALLQIAIARVLVLAFGMCAWVFVLDGPDRRGLASLGKKFVDTGRGERRLPITD